VQAICWRAPIRAPAGIGARLKGGRVSSVVLRELSKRYGAQTAVDNVSLRIEHGQLVCLLGPSGCGKSTILRLLAGFIEPSAGEVAMGERVVSSPSRVLPPEQRNVSMVFQSYALWPHMTVAQNVAYGLTLRKLERGAIASKVEKMLATTQLAALADRYPAELSGGQQQRVSLARALIVEPDMLLLDEPLSNLDANLREEMRFEVRRLHQTYHYTTVYVTHDQSEAMTTADLIAVMNAGRIEQLGTPRDIYEQPRSEFVARFLGGSNILRGKALDGRRLAFAGAIVECHNAAFAPGKPAAVAVRQHDIRLKPGDAAEPGANTLVGTVARNVFLGATRDYIVETAGSAQLRVTAAPEVDFAPGARVCLELPPSRCHALIG
jgi:iron(III) transport system ATP-binding protein